MKKFRYRLEPLLKLRTHEEKEKQKAFASADQKVRSQEELIRKVKETHREVIDRQKTHLEGRLSTTMLQAYGRYFRKLKTDQLTGQQMLAVLKRDAEQKRRELVEAARERKKFEKLKEKQQERFNKEFARLERQETDETAATTYRRRR